jgi:hypothetical protein
VSSRASRCGPTRSSASSDRLGSPEAPDPDRHVAVPPERPLVTPTQGHVPPVAHDRPTVRGRAQPPVHDPPRAAATPGAPADHLSYRPRPPSVAGSPVGAGERAPAGGMGEAAAGDDAVGLGLGGSVQLPGAAEPGPSGMAAGVPDEAAHRALLGTARHPDLARGRAALPAGGQQSVRFRHGGDEEMDAAAISVRTRVLTGGPPAFGCLDEGAPEATQVAGQPALSGRRAVWGRSPRPVNEPLQSP